MTLPNPWRKTTQHLMSAHAAAAGQELVAGQYNIYPAHDLGAGQIEAGFPALAQRIADAGQVMIDGYPGVLWADFCERLNAALTALSVTTHWIDVAAAMQSTAAIDALIAPFLGGDDPIFGYRFSGELADFFDAKPCSRFNPTRPALNIVYGCGAALTGWEGALAGISMCPRTRFNFASAPAASPVWAPRRRSTPSPPTNAATLWIGWRRTGTSWRCTTHRLDRGRPAPGRHHLCARGCAARRSDRSLLTASSVCVPGSSRDRGAGNGFASTCHNWRRTCPITPGRSN
jgi:hypothetical protein